MSPLAERILTKVQEIEGFAGGNLGIGLIDRNLMFCEGLTREGVDALDELVPLIEPKPVSLLVYLADGKMLKYPIAKTAGPYKKPRWVPVVFSLRQEAR